MATMEAITRIKAELPGVHTTLGVSNASFGLNPAARHVLNSVFLSECVKAGLDSAIVHAARIMPLSQDPRGAEARWRSTSSTTVGAPRARCRTATRTTTRW
jgi:cobalamin-dependent methionine synthase I